MRRTALTILSDLLAALDTRDNTTAVRFTHEFRRGARGRWDTSVVARFGAIMLHPCWPRVFELSDVPGVQFESVPVLWER